MQEQTSYNNCKHKYKSLKVIRLKTCVAENFFPEFSCYFSALKILMTINLQNKYNTFHKIIYILLKKLENRILIILYKYIFIRE